MTTNSFFPLFEGYLCTLLPLQTIPPRPATTERGFVRETLSGSPRPSLTARPVMVEIETLGLTYYRHEAKFGTF